MRRVVEITIAVLALVAAPLAVALVARLERPPNAAPAALVLARRIVGTTPIAGARIRLSGCTWSADASAILCGASGPGGPGTCRFRRDGTGSCRGSSGSGSWFLVVGGDHR